MLKINVYSDLGDFEHFNLFDFNNLTLYLRIGKICKYFAFPLGFTIPIGQIFKMWSLFANYDGMDEDEQHYIYTVPSILPKYYQVQMFFSEADKKLKKVQYDEMYFEVDDFEVSKFYNHINS